MKPKPTPDCKCKGGLPPPPPIPVVTPSDALKAREAVAKEVKLEVVKEIVNGASQSDKKRIPFGGNQIKPGEVRNPEGGRALGHKHIRVFGAHLRSWLKTRDWARDEAGKRIVGGKKELRLNTIVKRLAYTKPEVLLAYAYGKPVEMHDIQAAEGTEIVFALRVRGEDVP